MTRMKWLNITFLVGLLFGSTISAMAINTDSVETIIQTSTGIQKAKLLNLLSDEYLYTDPTKSLTLSKQSYILSGELDYTTEIAAISNLMEAFSRVNKYDSSDIFTKKGLMLSRQNKDTLRMMEFLTNMGWSYYSMGEYHKAIDSFTEAMTFFRIYIEDHPNSPNINVMNYAKLLNNKANVFYKQAYYDSAIYNYKKSLEYRQQHNAGPVHMAPTLQNIGGVYYQNKNYQEAYDYFSQAYDLYVQLADTSKMARVLNNLGMTHKALGDTNMAITNYEKAIILLGKVNNISGQINILNNLGTVYLQINEPEKAQHCIQQALDLNSEGRYKSALAASYLNMGSYFTAVSAFKKAIDMGNKSLELSLKIGNRSQLEYVYLLFSEAYEGLGKNSESLKWFKLHKTMHDSIFNEESQSNYNKLQVQLETAQKEKEIALLKKDQEKKGLETEMLKTRQRITIGIAVFITLFLLVLVYVIVYRRKKDKEIHRQKELYHKKEKELAKTELEKSRIKEEELQQSVLYKSKQLSTHALHMMQKNSLLHDIQSNIKNLSKQGTAEDKSDFKRINFQINQSLRSDKDWDVFKLYFEEVNRDFYQKLNDLNPELTTNDHRLCALIKLNMNSKEMASVLNVAPNSIKSSRYRLKKKLGLDMEADLEEFIRIH